MGKAAKATIEWMPLLATKLTSRITPRLTQEADRVDLCQRPEWQGRRTTFDAPQSNAAASPPSGWKRSPTSACRRRGPGWPPTAISCSAQFAWSGNRRDKPKRKRSTSAPRARPTSAKATIDVQSDRRQRRRNQGWAVSPATGHALGRVRDQGAVDLRRRHKLTIQASSITFRRPAYCWAGSAFR